MLRTKNKLHNFYKKKKLKKANSELRGLKVDLVNEMDYRPR